MLTDFSTAYSQRSDDELLHLATQRHSLTTEAAARGAGKLATLLGFVFFIAIYGCIRLLRRNFYGGESSEADGC